MATINEIFGFLDEANHNITQKPTELRVRGWAFSTLGDDLTIEIYLDGKLVKKTGRNIPRPDVARTYPKFKDSFSCGFDCTISLNDLKELKHILKVLAKTNDNEKIIGNRNIVLKTDEITKPDSNQKLLQLAQDFKVKLEGIKTKDKAYQNSELAEIFDELYLRYGSDEEAVINCPPYRIRKMVGAVGSIWAYAHVSSEYTTFLKILCNLKPHHKILEVGCGCGRVATSLRNFIKKPGAYYGLDVVPELIENAKMQIQNPLFHFTCMNVYSHMYNPDPKALKPEKVRFPYQDNFFDIVFLVSVFTHMIPPSIETYTKEIARVIKTKGKCLVTIFSLQNNPSYLKTKWGEKFPIETLHVLKSNTQKENFRVTHLDEPETAVMYDLNYVLQLFGKNGMKLIGKPYFGQWSGNPCGLTHQDVLILEKNKTT